MNSKVTVAKCAGFCFGVNRAVTITQEGINSGKKIATLGPIIHNKFVVDEFAKQGVRIINSPLEANEEETVVIRSHGVTKQEQSQLEERKIDFIDATCPFVKKIHKIVEEESHAGKHVVIIGDAKHPEVQGICGWAENQVTVIKTEEEAEAFSLADNKDICIVSQTTFNYNKFKYLVEIISKKDYNISVLNTICNATKERQTEAESIANEVDAMIVIGDKNSSNTQKLFEICKNACANTYYIQTLGDLEVNRLKSVQTVGITAGASTPNNIIEEVQNYVGINF